MATTKRTLSVEVLEDRQLCAVMGVPDGPMPQFPYPADRTGDVKNLVGSPGGSDSEWLDLGAPVSQRSDRAQYRMELVPKFWRLSRENSPEYDSSVQYRETDFDFATRLMEEEGIFYQLPELEIYDYPGEYSQRRDVPEFIVTGVVHTVRDMESPDLPRFEYQNSLQSYPAPTPFRPSRVTPKPASTGMQSGLEAIPSPDAIVTAANGRVKVQFHWDRPGSNAGDSSSWVRVGTPAAGKQWGMIHIPRIGQEVIVSFHRADSDPKIIHDHKYVRGTIPSLAVNIVDYVDQDEINTPFNFHQAEKHQDIEVENDETHWVRIR